MAQHVKFWHSNGRCSSTVGIRCGGLCLQVGIVSKAPQCRRQRRQAHMASAPAVAVSGPGASLQRRAAPLLAAKKAVSWAVASAPVRSGPGSSTNAQTSCRLR